MRARDGRIHYADTLVDVLLARAREVEGGFTFTGDGESVQETLAMSGLAERAVAFSAGLRQRVDAGKTAFLLFRPGLDFLVAFFGCLHAGVIAVPCAPPTRPFKRSIQRIARLVGIASPALIVAGAGAFPSADEVALSAPSLAACPVVSFNQLMIGESSGTGAASRARPEGVAFLQFTSGSIADPKGVMITHANLMNNLADMHECLEHSRASVSVTWLPIYHDMGLIDGMLQPVFAGSRCVAMPPHAFVQRPDRWLKAISRHRASHAGGPNFAYDLCVQRTSPERSAGLDLSSWKFAYCSAEPIRIATLESFTARFSSAGFRYESFYPCYGLAEATLKVSGGRADALHPRFLDAAALERGKVVELERGAPVARPLASSGVPGRDVVVAIVDPESREALAEEAIGEIWVAGASVAAGYYGDRSSTEDVFRARIEPDLRGPFLRTGDLGFMKGGELYVTGRRKDLIIMAGRNLYPQDIELSAESAHAFVATGGAAAFSLDDGSREHLVVLVETSRSPSDESAELPQIADAVARAIAREHLIDATVVAVLPRGALLKTTSGKIRRHACKQAFLNRGIAVLARRDLAGGIGA